MERRQCKKEARSDHPLFGDSVSASGQSEEMGLEFEMDHPDPKIFFRASSVFRPLGPSPGR
jgi:hypothetical protein